MVNLKPILLLLVVLLPSMEGITVRFNNDEVAEYSLLKVDDEKSLQYLHGGQAFIRFAVVVSSPPGYIFQEGQEVAIKIGDYERGLSGEQKAQRYLQDHAPEGFIDGVVRAEKYMGECLDLDEDENFVPPPHHVKLAKYSVLILEPLGMDLMAMCQLKRGLPPADMEAIYDQIRKILKDLRDIRCSFGDFKPQNVLFRKSNDVKDGICLVDLGLAVFTDSNVEECAGDQIYVSPIQFLQNRAICDIPTERMVNMKGRVGMR